MTIPPRSLWRAPGLLSLLAAVVLSGCGKSHDSDGAPTTEKSSQAPEAAKEIDSLTWNLPGGGPNTLDPVKSFSGSDLLVSANVCESLLRLQPSGEAGPGLASSVDQPDETTLVVHLREGVTFFDGSPMTADDVVFSLDRIRDPKAGSYWGYFASHVSSVEATDDQTVTIKLDQPDAIFYQMLATPLGQVVQKQFVEDAGKDYGSPKGGVMCTGPYEVAAWNSGNDLVLKANDGWWGREDSPQLNKEVKFTFVTEDSTITSALLNGDIDGTFDIPFSTNAKLTDAPDGGVYQGPSTKQLVLIPTDLNGDGALAKVELRQALAKSIDYEGILGTTLAGVADPLRAVATPGTWGSAVDEYQAAYDELGEPARDLEAAKKLIADSGVSSPAITIAVPADIPEYVSLGETIQSNAEEAGFDVTLKPLPGADFSALYGDAKARSKVDAFLSDWYADIADPAELYIQFGIPGGAADYGGYDNPEVAAQLQDAVRTIDDDARADLTIQAQATLTEDLVWIPLAYPLQTVFLNDRLGGVSTAFPFVMYAPWLPTIGGR